MGDINRRIDLQRLFPEVQGPIPEVGSKDNGNTFSYRDQLVGNDYVGVDMAECRGVDKICSSVTTRCRDRFV